MATTLEPRSLRERTRDDIYQLIRSLGVVTRTELVELTGMSRSTVNHAVGRLLTEGVVAESEAQPKGPGSGSGRPATSLRAIASGSPVATLDFGHTHVWAALGDSLGHLITDDRVAIDVDMNATQAMDLAADLLARLRAETGNDQFAAVVAGIPGPVDRRTGLVRSPTILSGWVGLSPSQELERRLGQPCHVTNDSVLGAHGELRLGAGRFHRDFLYVKASNGIGAGLVVDGATYTGGAGLAGEIGHTQIAGRTEPCRCGDRGCLEAVVSVLTVTEQILHAHPGLDAASLDLSTLTDAISLRIFADAGRTLGRVLADLCNLLNPSAVIVGGELGASGPALIEGVSASINRHAQPAIAASAEVCAASLGIRAEVLGGLHLASTLAPR